jgi:hypothetical protein
LEKLAVDKVNGRRDIGAMYLKTLSEVLIFVDDGANILLITAGWNSRHKRLIGMICHQNNPLRK